jgi:hypothetical protein
VNNGKHVLHSLARLARDLCDSIGHWFLTRKTKIRRNLWIMDNLFCVCFAPGEAAASSLGTGQGVEDFLHLGIRFNMKLLGCHGQSDTKEEADTSKGGHTGQRQFD